MSKSIVIRCDAYPEIGLGHIMRCLSIAGALKGDFDWQVVFACHNSGARRELVEEAGFIFISNEDDDLSPCDEAKWLEGVVSQVGASAVLLDIRNDLPLDCLRRLREAGCHISSLDDPSPRRLLADAVFYPPVPQVDDLDWQTFKGQKYVGWQWYPLRQSLANYRTQRLAFCKTPRTRKKIGVTMGGSDPAGLTLLVLKQLDELDLPFDVTVLIGPDFVHRDGLEEFLRTARRGYHIVDPGYTIWQHLLDVDFAIISFGQTAYELAAIGIGSVILALSDDHASSASIFGVSELAVTLGNYQDIGNMAVGRAAAELISNPELCMYLSKRGAEFLDINSSFNVASRIDSDAKGHHS